MLRLTWIELFLRNVPEVFILMWGVHVLSRKPIDIPKYIISSIFLVILTFFVRWLPIYFGVHMIINMIMTISIIVIIGIPLIKSIYSDLLITILLSLSELLNMVILRLLNIDTSDEFLTPLIKCIYGMPSLAILVIFIIIINRLFKMKEGMENVSG